MKPGAGGICDRYFCGTVRSGSFPDGNGGFEDTLRVTSASSTSSTFCVDSDFEADDCDVLWRVRLLWSGGFLSRRRGLVKDRGYDDINPVHLGGVVVWSQNYSSSGSVCSSMGVRRGA